MNDISVPLIPLDYLFTAGPRDGPPEPMTFFEVIIWPDNKTVGLLGKPFWLHDLVRLCEAWYKVGYHGTIFYDNHILCSPDGLYINSIRFFQNWDDFGRWIERMITYCEEKTND